MPQEPLQHKFAPNNPVPGVPNAPENLGQVEPVTVVPRTVFPNPCNQFQMFPTTEMDFIDGINAEMAGIAGVDAEYFVMNRTLTPMDPYYNEPTADWSWTKSFRIRVFYLPDQGDPTQREPTERGLAEVHPGQVTIGRRIAEEVGLGAPKEGDVIRLFHHEGRGYADYDVIKVNPDPGSYWGDQGVFLQFLCDVVRRLKFLPERRFTAGNETEGVTESDSDPRSLIE